MYFFNIIISHGRDNSFPTFDVGISGNFENGRINNCGKRDKSGATVPFFLSFMAHGPHFWVDLMVYLITGLIAHQ